MEQSQRSSASSSGYAFHGSLDSPPAGSATSSVYDARSSLNSHQPPLTIALPPPFSSFPRQAQSSDRENISTRPVSAASLETPRTVVKSVRRASLDSPRSAQHPKDSPIAPPSPSDYTILQPRNLDEYPHGLTPTRHSIHSNSVYSTGSDPFSLQDSHPLSSSNHHFLASPLRPTYERSATSYHTANNSISDYEPSASDHGTDQSRESIMLSNKGSPKPPDLTLQVDSNAPAVEPKDTTKKPKSPGVSSFFGWKRSASNQNDSPTTISDSRSVSPAPSPLNKAEVPNEIQQSPVLGEEEDDDYFMNGSYYDSTSPHPGGAPSSSADELLRELRDVSTELAASIRREMELEDEVDRYKTDMPTGPTDHNRRTSDYYSDSGASSIRLIAADSETKIEGLEKMRRKAEQEKAQLRLEMSQKAQEDLNQRRALEMQVQSLEQQLQSRGSADGERSVEHQRAMDDVKRKLNEERQFKENFEDLLSGMRQEIEAHRNERDNLRDEVVPQLKSRIEGLEAEASEKQTLTYENSRLQQELQNLKNDQDTLHNSRVKRSNSLMKSKDGQAQSDLHGDGFKALEDQRDALQRTLKSLILRQQSMVKNHAKQIRSLEAERDKALTSTPRRTALQHEVHELRHEINQLRRRADDALEQKWQSEKGLSSLKMDLDRAQHETGSLRALLKDSDISEPAGAEEAEGDDSLHAAYASLQSTHADSMARLQSKADEENDADALKLVQISRNRMRDLSKEVESQLALNAELQERLKEAVTRGVKEQEASAKKIADLETALRAAEEQVVAATNTSEDAITQEEEYVKTMRDAADEHSRRGLSRSHANTVSSKDLNSPFSIKSPRLDMPSSGKSTSASEASRTEALQRRVRELEDAAMRADQEMQDLVEKMSRAQIEVAELQMERDESAKQTRRLQREIVAERERIRALTA